MAVESKIEENRQWFTNEDKTLRYRLDPPVAITGWTFLWELRKTRRDVTPLLTKTTAGGTVVATDPAAGVVSVLVAAVDTVGLDGGTYHHVLWRDDPGQRTVLSYGPAVLRRVTES